MSTLDGWLTTKKPGKDDKAIETARQKAIDNKRAKKGLAPKKKQNGTKKAKAKAPAKKKKARGGFVASSDEEEDSELEAWDEDEEEIELSEEEEDVVLSEEESDDDDDDSDGPSSSFLPKTKSKREFKIAPMMQQAAKLKKSNKAKANGFKAAKKSATTLLDSDDDDDEDDDFQPTRNNKNSLAAKKPTRAAAVKPNSYNENDDIDLLDSDEELTSPEPRAKPTAAASKSKYFDNKKKNGASLSSDEEDDYTPGRPASKKPAGRKRIIAHDDENYEEMKIAADYEDDDEVVMLSSPARVTENNDDDDSDDPFAEDPDENVALQAAIKASMREKNNKDEKKKGGRLKKLGKKNHQKKRQHAGKSISSKSSKRKKKIEEESPTAEDDAFLKDSDEEPAESEEEEKAIEILDATSSEEEDEPEVDDQDEYMDDDAREASTVLAAANELSASVLRVMTQWASDLNDGEGGEDDLTPGKMKIPQGIIVDGALAISSLKKKPGTANKKNDSNSHGWISAEVMQKILPKVTLSEYQLLGVNWLAMLHSMTCTVTGDKKPTPVNGILADEMGLGKTCQTIAFLAWLKYRRSTGALDDQDGLMTKEDQHKIDNNMSENEESDVEIEPEVINVSKSTPAKHAEISTQRKDEESAPPLHLIVVPASVVSNWEREFNNFAPLGHPDGVGLNIIKYHGTMEERMQMKHDLRKYLRGHRDAPEVDVILTSITYFQKESSEDRDFLKKFNFDYLICDEGHLLKNAKGLRYKNLDRFGTRHRLLLTGTPVQNSPQELMALLCFLMPLFSRKTNEFDEQQASDGGQSMLQHFVNLEEQQNAGVTSRDSHEFAYRKLKQLFAPFVLRRRKIDVLSQILPPKVYQVEMVTLPEGRARAQYNAVIENHLIAKKNKTNRASDHLFTMLRKAAHHPHLLRTRHNSPAEIDHLTDCLFKYGAFTGDATTKERVAQETETWSDFEIHLTAHELLDQNHHRSADLDRYLLSKDDLFASAKFARLRDILPNLIKDGHRILIFSVWTTCLDLLGCLVEEMELDYLRMDGQTPVADRQELVDKWNGDNSIPVFLLSTKACGMGLNLTGADTCIFHDIDMNPFSDLQAEDRCHRIGQKKPVTIIKLISKDTVDSDIYEMQERKKRMNEAIMENSTDWKQEEKKEKTRIMQTVVERHSKETSTSSGKENVENTNGNVSAREPECDI